MAKLRQHEVLDRCAISRTTLYRLVEAGDFPPPIRLGGRTVVWTEEAIDQWIMRLIREQRGE
ncbi:AlpA family phage regulatory protein [Halomonas sp. NO4]|uniref:helix-turn-helix transcriptional regulator n=1 Tax=Halomonas sp. NO4 TaxID=2484813 RepID=UPI0013D68762|nr:AlpA family phage regulatory protein [Halomonas sp. NO4]